MPARRPVSYAKRRGNIAIVKDLPETAGKNEIKAKAETTEEQELEVGLISRTVKLAPVALVQAISLSALSQPNKHLPIHAVHEIQRSLQPESARMINPLNERALIERSQRLYRENKETKIKRSVAAMMIADEEKRGRLLIETIEGKNLETTVMNILEKVTMDDRLIGGHRLVLTATAVKRKIGSGKEKEGMEVAGRADILIIVKKSVQLETWSLVEMSVNGIALAVRENQKIEWDPVNMSEISQQKEWSELCDRVTALEVGIQLYRPKDEKYFGN